ncbi:MAG: transketolase [Nitrospirae bacterium]|nr:transketolase [Nitrospirota bacterium]
MSITQGGIKLSLTEEKFIELNRMACRIRTDIVEMLNQAGSGHTGGSLSAADIITALYFHKLRHNPADPNWAGRDRFILSKGHAAPVLYAALARSGYFPVGELKTLRQVGSRLQGHPDSKKLPGVEVSTGSLGQGLSMACGVALSARLDKMDTRVYALLGDGELQEGQVWEAVMLAAHYGLENLTAIVDNNGLQIDGACSEVMCVDPISDKFKAFGWDVIDIDGHDIAAIVDALDRAGTGRGRPTAIVAKTIKGKGCSLFEGKVEYHGTPPSDEELKVALEEIGKV